MHACVWCVYTKCGVNARVLTPLAPHVYYYYELREARSGKAGAGPCTVHFDFVNVWFPFSLLLLLYARAFTPHILALNLNKAR